MQKGQMFSMRWQESCEMVGWQQQTPEVSEGLESLACYSPWGLQESQMQLSDWKTVVICSPQAFPKDMEKPAKPTRTQ